MLSRAAGLEAQTDHPLARAIVEHARSRNIPLAVVSDFQVIPGKGARGRIDGRDYWLGSHRYLEERAQETPDLHEALEQRSASGQTVVVVGSDEHVCGLIALADAIRPESADAIGQLKALGIKPVVMLTGDNRPTAEAIAARAGIDEVRAELLPEDKGRGGRRTGRAARDDGDGGRRHQRRPGARAGQHRHRDGSGWVATRRSKRPISRCSLTTCARFHG